MSLEYLEVLYQQETATLVSELLEYLEVLYQQETATLVSELQVTNTVSV